MNIKMNVKSLLAGAVALAGFAAVGEPTVTVESVESGDPWTQVTVRYTLGGLEEGTDYKVVFDFTANGTTCAITNVFAELVDKTYEQTLDVSKIFNPAKPDPKATVKIKLIEFIPGVQLWENGPYWADCNIGATVPEDRGYYFYWGDTIGYTRNDSDTGWISTKDGSSYTFDRYGVTGRVTVKTLQETGWIDENYNLTMEHDAARTHLRKKWRMPTCQELDDLYYHCDVRCVTNRNLRTGVDVPGWRYTGKGAFAKRSIFLPATGVAEKDELLMTDLGGYWSASAKLGTSSSEDPTSSIASWQFYFTLSGYIPIAKGREERGDGMPIRAVHD